MILSLEQKVDYLIIDWQDGTTNQFYYPWLWDNQPNHRHQNGQKLTDCQSINLAIKPATVNWTDRDLVIQWEGVHQDTVYSLQWLKTFSSKKEMKSISLWKQLNQPPIYDFEEVKQSAEVLLKCLKDIQLFGFTQLDNVPSVDAMVLKLVNLFGYVRETNYGKYYDVKSIKKPNNLADTNLGLAPHTDNPYRNPTPTIQVLHCLKADVEGGQSILVDGFYVVQQLPREYFDLLANNKVSFKFETANHCLEHEAPILELNTSGELLKIKFNNRSIQPFNLQDEIMIPFYKAYQYFERQLNNPENQWRFKLNPGQAIIYDNERILHGRTAFQLISERHLQGCYADRDGLNSTIAVLERKFALHEK